MADDLATLRPFGTFQDEEEMRQEVAARVVANSSRAALDDEEKMAQAWRDLEKAERRVTELEMDLSEAQSTAAQASSSPVLQQLLSSSPPPEAEAPTAAEAAVRRVSDLKFQLHAAQVELKRVDAAVRQTQKEVDRRQAARLAEAQRKEKEQAAADRLAAATPRTATVATAPLHAGAPSTHVASSTSSNNSIAAAAAANSGASAPTATSVPTTRTTTRVLYRVPRHLRGVTQSDYSGGEVLPSLSRVQVTRADIRSKQRRYQDDSDMTHYLERIAKRQRLEAMASQQRRLAAASSSSAAEVKPSSPAIAAVEGTAAVRSAESISDTRRGGGGDGGGGGGKALRMKQESGATAAEAEAESSNSRGTTTTTRKRKSRDTRAVKKEEEEEANDVFRPQLKAMKREEDAERVPVAEEDDSDENSVIDVDALMEDDDDAAVEAAMHRASVHLHKAGSLPCGTTTPQLSQLSQPAYEAEGELTDLVVEMEEVTLLPGVRMDATIYNRLLDYQQEGLLWLLSLHARRAGGILGDEMGLGKTIQVAALLNALHHSCMLRGPVLIVSPMTVLRQWLAELHRWAPYMRSCVMHESSGSDGGTRESLLRSVQGTPAVVVTTYAAMRAHCALLQRTGFQYVILDEGHKISNPEAGVTLAAKSFTTPHRLILSGSPIQNSLKELWCLFDFVRPGLLGTMNRFIDEFELPISQSRNVRASPLALATAVECAKTLQHHIAPYLLRRLKRQVNTKLPPKYERVLRVPLTDQQLEQYLQVLSSPVVQRLFAQTVMYGSSTGGLDRDGRDSTGSLHVAGARLNMATRRNNSGVRLESFRLMNQLRQICNHADIYSVQRGADEEDRMLLSRRGAAAAAGRAPPLRPGQHRSFRSNNPVNLLGSGKLNALLMMLQEWKAFDHRVLVFSQTRMMLDIIENMCEQQGYTYIRMDGATNGHHRQELMDRFNEDENIFVALLTTRVGGIGVNLIGADRVVIFDPDWNPTTDVQARERAWRIGQRREVCVYRLITSGSVEEAILRRQLAKMYVTDKVLNDPELQRFFHVQDSFMENFLLGAEYEPRVPMDKKYLLTAHQLHNSTSATRRANGDAATSARRLPMVDETLGDYGAPVPGDDDDSSTDSSDAEVMPVKAEGEDEVVKKNEGNVDDGVKQQHGDNKPKQERDFGLLVPIKDEDYDANDDDGVTTGQHGSTSAATTAVFANGTRTPASLSSSANNTNRGHKNGKEWSETQLLQSLVDHQDVAVTGNDRVAHRLARRKAQDMMQRVSSRASVVERMQQQQRQFSLLNALEEKKAAEAAEREEWRQSYQEEMLAVASKRRRREE
ncbi:SNF2 family helicase-like protein [Lotmaria passim]